MLKKRLLTDRSGELHDKILAEKAQEIAREIDREILWGMLSELGWHRVMIDKSIDNAHAIDITHWLEENCKGAYERSGRDFIFEEEKDTMWFKLRWLG